MAELTEKQKLYVVTRLAVGGTPTEIQTELKQDGVDVSLPALAVYDPRTVTGEKLGKKLKDVFTETRKRYLEEIVDVEIAHQAWRLRQLQVMLEKPDKNPVVLKNKLAILEQAAKEVGGAFSQIGTRRDASSPNGAATGVVGYEVIQPPTPALPAPESPPVLEDKA